MNRCSSPNPFVVPILIVVMVILAVFISPKVNPKNVFAEKKEMTLDDLQVYCQNMRTIAIPKEDEMDFNRIVETPNGVFILLPDDLIIGKNFPSEGEILLKSESLTAKGDTGYRFWSGHYRIGKVSDRFQVDYTRNREDADLIFSLNTEKLEAEKEKDS